MHAFNFCRLEVYANMKSGPVPAESQRKRTAYVCNLMSTDDTSGWISVIDLESRILTKNIKVGKFPVFSLVHPHDRKKLIVTLHNYTRKEGGGVLELVDLQTDKVIQREQYHDVAIPTGMVYDGKWDVLYVADENEPQGYVRVHDGKTLKWLYSFPAGSNTTHVHISSDGRHLVATNRPTKTSVKNLYVFGVEKNPATARDGIFIPLDTRHPYDVKFSGNPDICYVTDNETGELLVVDITRRMVTDRIKAGKNLFGMALDKGGTTVYVCDMGSNSVSVVDISSKKIIDKITGLEGRPSHCAIDEEGRQLVVACHGDPASSPGPVHIIDLATKTVVATIVDEKLLVSIGVTIEA